MAMDYLDGVGCTHGDRPTIREYIEAGTSQSVILEAPSAS